MAGLVIGKPLGIVGLSLAAIRLRLARPPAGINAKVLLGAGLLAGIGFTMSLFIAALAFDDEHHLAEAKIGILLGPAISAVGGVVLLRVSLPAAGKSGNSAPTGQDGSLKPAALQTALASCRAHLLSLRDFSMPSRKGLHRERHTSTTG